MGKLPWNYSGFYRVIEYRVLAEDRMKF